MTTTTTITYDARVIFDGKKFAVTNNRPTLEDASTSAQGYIDRWRNVHESLKAKDFHIETREVTTTSSDWSSPEEEAELFETPVFLVDAGGLWWVFDKEGGVWRSLDDGIEEIDYLLSEDGRAKTEYVGEDAGAARIIGSHGIQS